MSAPTYNDHNAHPRDPQLNFNPESHTYTHAGAELLSVTTLVKEFFPKFDAEYWAARKALTEGVDPQVILDRWERDAERARTLGTQMHDRIEHFYLNGHSDTEPDTDVFPLFRRFAAHHHLHPFRTEWRIFHEDFGVAGTLDFLERTPNGTYNIYDWKRSSKLVERNGRIISDNRYGKRALSPISHLSDCSYWHYALQLSVYSYILEEKYGIHVSNLYLGVFHPEYSCPWTFQLPDLRREAIQICRLAREVTGK